MSRRLYVDPDKCMGHGRCYTIAPELLSEDEQGFVEQRGQELDVPDDLIDRAELAVDACPECAISLRRSD